MNLKTLAKTHTTPEGVVFYMLPYTTLLSNVAIEEMQKLIPEGEWGNIHNIFVLADPVLVDIEFPDDMASEWRGLQMYWQERNGSTAHNWDMFQQMIGYNVITRLNEAYNGTRDDTVKAAPEPKKKATRKLKTSGE